MFVVILICVAFFVLGLLFCLCFFFLVSVIT